MDESLERVIEKVIKGHVITDESDQRLYLENVLRCWRHEIKMDAKKEREAA